MECGDSRTEPLLGMLGTMEGPIRQALCLCKNAEHTTRRAGDSRATIGLFPSYDRRPAHTEDTCKILLCQAEPQTDGLRSDNMCLACPRFSRDRHVSVSLKWPYRLPK